MRTLFKFLLAALCCAAGGGAALAQTVSTLPNFAQRYTANASGDIRIVGNTVMTCSGANCNDTITDGTSTVNLNNNNQTMVNIDVDAADPGLNGYNNSSSASFALPVGASVLKAYLYWYAEGASAAVTTQRGQVKLRTAPGGSYTTITASAIYQAAAPGTGVGYNSVADITAYVPQASTTFTVAGIATQAGVADTYGGWSIVLVLADPAEPFRKLTVFDGLKAVSSTTPVTINLALGGNATPPSGSVSMRMGVIAGEGDRGTVGDALSVRSYASPGQAPNAYTTLANDAGAPNNFFNSSITRIGSGGTSEPVVAKDPHHLNNLGVDMDVFEVPNAGNVVVQNSSYALDINLTSTGDVYLPSVVTTAVQLYVPNVQQSMTKTVVDLNGGDVMPGDVLEYTVAFSNTGGDYADAMTLLDAIPANTTYVPGSMAITGPNAGAKDDAAGNDQAEYLTSGCAPVAAPCVRARLGVGANGSVGGTINPQPQANSATSFSFRVQVNAGTPVGTAIDNVASVTYTARTLAQTFTVNSPAAATTSGAANLRLVKSHVGDFTQGQANAVYTQRVVNDGGVTTAPFTVTDTLPAGLSFASASGTNWSCAAAGQTVTCDNTNAAPLALGASSTLVLRVNVAPTAGSALVNTATVSGGGENAATAGNNTASDPTTVAGAPNLTVAKVANATPWTTGQTGRTYTVTASNAGTALTGTPTTTVTEAPPAGMAVTAMSGTNWSCTQPAGPCVRASDLASAASFEPIVVTVNVAGNAASPLVNQASVTVAGEAAPEQGNNTASDSTVVEPTIDLALSHSTSTTTPTAGTPFTLTLTLGNSGSIAASNVSVIDVLPAGWVLGGSSAGQGSYNSSTGVWNVGSVAAGGSATLALTVTAGAAGAATHSAQVLSATERDRDSTPGNSVPGEDDQSSLTLTVGPAGGGGGGVAVSGTVYADANHNALRDGGESGIGLVLYAKLVSAASPAGPAVQAVATDAASGAYTFGNVSAGEYTVVLDDNNSLADVSPAVPAGWIGTENPAGRRVLTVATTDVPNQHFGLFNGASISGRVFEDNGAGGGTPNDGLAQGGEAGIARVPVRATDAAGAVVWDSTLTDGAGRYTLYVPAAAGNVRVVQANLAAHVSTGGSAGNTGGTYDRSSDHVAFGATAGVAYASVDFGDVRETTLAAGGRQTAAPGSSVFYAHRLLAGSAGSVVFALSSPAAGFGTVLYRDTDCSGTLEATEPVLSANTSIAVVAGGVVCAIVKDSVAANTPPGSTHPITLSATLTYTNASPALQSAHSNTDATTVAAPGALWLAKRQSTAAALPGATIVYTVAYSNRSAEPLSA